ncbi:MAG: class I SAM-dependent methyltransferase [Candidatus Dormibacteria bacterium]
MSSEHWDQRFAERPWISHPDPLLTEVAGELAPGRAIDLGCGPGRNAIWLAERGFQVTGVDASAVGLRQARERAAAAGVHLDLVLADLRSYLVSESTFDLAVVANLHPGPGELGELLARAVVGLVPGGHLFVVGHHLDNLGLDGPGDPELLYTVERLAAELPSGLAVDRLERVERHPGRQSGGPDAAVLLWGRRLALGDPLDPSLPGSRDGS